MLCINSKMTLCCRGIILMILTPKSSLFSAFFRLKTFNGPCETFSKSTAEVRRHKKTIKKAQLPCQYPDLWLTFLKEVQKYSGCGVLWKSVSKFTVEFAGYQMLLKVWSFLKCASRCIYPVGRWAREQAKGQCLSWFRSVCSFFYIWATSHSDLGIG